MIKKYCPNCRKTSYSACAEGVWVCPTCSHDLTREPVLPLNLTGDRNICISCDKPEVTRQKVRHLTLIHSR